MSRGSDESSDARAAARRTRPATPAGWGGSQAAAGETPGHEWDVRPTENLNVLRTRTLVYPREIRRALPMTAAANRTVVESRAAIQAILRGEDRRLLAVVGPCSIHDEEAALEYARRLRAVGDAIADRALVVMRVYFEKPRTTVGWTGLVYDPHLDGSFDIDAGVRRARALLLKITELGVPAGTEMLDPITPQYLADLVSWAAIGARTTESQTHRQMASGLSMPVGFKNSTDGSLTTALDALAAAGHPHSFLGIDENGLTAIIDTRGNPWVHLILRGGRSGPNYDAGSVAAAAAELRARNLPPAVMVDCSHANSAKQAQNQARAWRDVLAQRAKSAAPPVIGMMLESNLMEGSQPMPADPRALRYGVSITDACIGWEETETLLREA